MNWAQLQAIVWLRWRLSRNQFVRGGQLNAILAVLVLVFMLFAGLGLAVGGFALGFFVAAQSPPGVLLLIWDGVIILFTAFWFSGLMVEIQRSEVVDFTKLLHLPVTLPQVFAFNYVASHFTPAIVALLPAMLGLCAGTALGGGPYLVLMVPLVLGFVFAVTAWTYCLRGWLVALMTNKRRRRTIIVWVALAFVLIAQTPNLLINSNLFRRQPPKPAVEETGKPGDTRGLPTFFVQAHAIVPLGWPGYGAMQLAQGNPWSALALTTTAFLIAALGLTRAYQMTMRYYRGAEGPVAIPGAAAPVSVKPREPRVPGRLLVERRLPWLPDDTAALALATFRSLLRAPELKMALVMPVILCIVLAGIRFNRVGLAPPDDGAVSAFAAFALTGVIVTTAFMLTPTMSNVFGLDRNGFRALVLLPVRRDKVMFAKNLAFFPFAAAVTVLVMALVTWAFRVPWQVFLVGLVQMPTAFLLFTPICNLFSIVVPYRLSEGTLKAQKPKAMVFLAAFGTLLITPIVLVPIVIPPVLQLMFSVMRWTPWLPVHLLSALLILAGAAWLYRILLPVQGRLLQRREQTILREVTAEVE